MAIYLVTGAAGFIASTVTRCLLADGHTVIGVDNLNEAYDIRLKQWQLDQLKQHPRFHFHHLDICNQDQLEGLFSSNDISRNGGFAAVINLAARAGVRQSVQNPWIYYETNTTGTLNLLELCRTHGVPKFVLASTSSLYGAHNPCPFGEEANTDQPLSPYAASKKAAEGLGYTYHYLYDINVSVVRYFTVYGPAGRPDMSLFRFVQWISEGRPVTVFGDGQQSRDFTYVDDIARGTIASLDLTGYQIINLGSDQPVVLMDAIHLIEELVGQKAQLEFRPRHPADILATWANINKARRLLNWEPQTSFEQGAQALTAWYQEHRSWAKNIQTGATL